MLKGGAMPEEPAVPLPDTDVPPPPPPAKVSILRKPWAIPTAAGVLGLVLGAVVGIVASQSDPTTSAEYQALQVERDEAQAQADELDDLIDDTKEEARLQIAEAAEKAQANVVRSVELDEREKALGERETAVSGAEAQVAANTIAPGRWTVGVDIEPGAYRVKDAVTSTRCYWAITRTGSNGDDILSNDYATQGNLAVTLSAGQDFESSDCGSWVKQ